MQNVMPFFDLTWIYIPWTTDKNWNTTIWTKPCYYNRFISV